MARRGYLVRRVRGTANEEAVEHMRQRRELSRLVQGIDNDVLEIFFRLDAATLGKLAFTYEQLFGSDAANYLHQALPEWRAGRTGVSGRNAARLLIVVPLFLTDAQREVLRTKMRHVGLDEQAGLWLEGQHSSVRESIKTVAGRGTGRALPTLPASKPSVKPTAPQYLSNAVIISPPPTAPPPTRLQDLPPSPSAPQRTAPAANPSSGCAVAVVAFIVLGVVLLIGNNPAPTSRAREDAITASTASTPLPAINTSPAPASRSSGFASSTAVQPAPAPFYPKPLTLAVPRPTVAPPHVVAPLDLQVRFIRKPNSQRTRSRITQIGGTNADGSLWALTQADAIAGLKSGKYRFFVVSTGGNAEMEVTTSRAGNLMLKTVPDGISSNNLLSLPDFPVQRGR